jgi:hypothetical protein
VVLLGDGLGGFALPVVYPFGKDPKSLLSVDLKGDGIPDLVTANKGDDTVSVLQGTGAFASAVDHAVEGASSGLAWGDFNGDCVADLAVTNRKPAGRLGVLPGDGTGDFWPVESFDLGASPKALAGGDLNGDLKMDLVATLSAGSEAVVLLNDAVQPCTTFGVRRSTDPATVRSAPVHAVPPASPFDDDSGTLSDGQFYFYVVDSAAQTPLTLSVHANPAADAVRLGFNDGDPSSADPAAALISVEAAPGTVPAGGVSTATVLVVPRDADGVELGSGLSLAVDETLLLPGVLAGPVVDLGNGTYRFPVASSTAGVGTVSVSVEGVQLVDAPSLRYQAPERRREGGLPEAVLAVPCRRYRRNWSLDGRERIMLPLVHDAVAHATAFRQWGASHEWTRTVLPLDAYSRRRSLDRPAVLLQLGEHRLRAHHGRGDQEEGGAGAHAAYALLVPLGRGLDVDHRRVPAAAGVLPRRPAHGRARPDLDHRRHGDGRLHVPGGVPL